MINFINNSVRTFNLAKYKINTNLRFNVLNHCKCIKTIFYVNILVNRNISFGILCAKAFNKFLSRC